MLDPKEQARFNKNCADAAKGYAEAAGEAYADMAQKSLEMWTSSFASLLGAGAAKKPEPKSWYRKPLDGEIFPPSQAAFPFAQDKPEPAWPFSQWMALNPFFANNPFAAAIPFMRPSTAGSAPVFGPFATMPGFGAEQASPFDPGQMMSAHFKAMANPFWPMMAWWTFAQSGLSPKAWPMAFGMIASGVPQKVAWPTAAANAAAQEAAQTATRSIDAAFARYHTSTGHASAQIVNAGPFMIAIAIAPIGAAALMPWLSLPPPVT
jgi:hypothetical protein